MTRNEEKIKELCSSASADINLCRVAYTVIDNAPEEEKATLLEAFIIGYRNTPTNHSLDLPCFMDDKKKDLMLKKYGRQVDKRIHSLPADRKSALTLISLTDSFDEPELYDAIFTEYMDFLSEDERAQIQAKARRISHLGY